MATHEYPEGLDCIWLAADRNGYLGAFVTGGAGPIPTSALSESSFPIEDVEAEVCGLPNTSEARLLVPMKRPDDFIEMAQRGFFVYDWRDVHRTLHDSSHAYELIAVPLTPLKINELPEHLWKLATTSKLPDSAFVNELALDVETCCNAVVLARDFEKRESLVMLARGQARCPARDQPIRG